MKKIFLILTIASLFGSCASGPINLSAAKLDQLCSRRLLVYRVQPYKGGHIVRVSDRKSKGWFFTMNKPDSVQEGTWINGVRIFTDRASAY